MNKQQIDQLLQNNNYESPSVVETHISWVFFTRQYAYKMKKDIKFSFVDFSTLEKRKYYCERELELNRRLAPNLYLAVVPVCQTKEHVTLEDCEDNIIGYAVKMRRVDSSHEMDSMLMRNEVTKTHMEQLASQLATFHAFTDSIEGPIDLEAILEDFADIGQHRKAIESFLGLEAGATVEEAIHFARDFLDKHHKRFEERRANGFTVDGHGDLHTGNIFLEDEPIIFDCIDFSDHLREVDVLDEIAFFCLDLESYQREDLASHFLHHYLLQYPCMPEPEDRAIFEYYKFYRANVKLKVTILKLLQPQNEQNKTKLLNQLNTYYSLFQKCMSELNRESL